MVSCVDTLDIVNLRSSAARVYTPHDHVERKCAIFALPQSVESRRTCIGAWRFSLDLVSRLMRTTFQIEAIFWLRTRQGGTAVGLMNRRPDLGRGKERASCSFKASIRRIGAERQEASREHHRCSQKYSLTKIQNELL